ncbi:MAG: Transport-related membrane protein [uncultured Caballeronia sp.]|nr:MAG: Transport-related membrane protein [uncultured Caballeronia sp.]
MGLAMLLQLPQPRVAMTTAVVLMQPLAGMVLAKSVYRLFGTLLGAAAALVLGGVLVQQPEAYMAGLTGWVAVCTALAVRYRHFRWYGFVLAGYTAALIGILAVNDPNGLLLASLNRAAEITLGILCSGAISALVMPLHASAVFAAGLRRRDYDFKAFVANVFDRSVGQGAFEQRFGAWVDETVLLDAQLRYAAYETLAMRAQSCRIARLNSEFLDACARLHALHQLLRRVLTNDGAALVDLISTHLDAFAILLRTHDNLNHEAEFAASLGRFQAGTQEILRTGRARMELDAPALLPDFATAIELLFRFVDDFARYTRTHVSVVIASFLRTATTVALIGGFWIVTALPSGGMAVIAATLACGLCATSARPSRLALQMAAGAAVAVIVGGELTRYVYPAIDGFVLLCAVLAPVIVLGTYVAVHRRGGGFGTSFLVFFCLLAGPDNLMAYAPETLMNNGLAVVLALLAVSLCFALVCPPNATWLVERTQRELRAQVARACEGKLAGSNHRFHASTHDLMFQLRSLLADRSREHRRALRWMLATLEVGQAVIDLRGAASSAASGMSIDEQGHWRAAMQAFRQAVSLLFTAPTDQHWVRALGVLGAVVSALEAAQQSLGSSAVHGAKVTAARCGAWWRRCISFARHCLIVTRRSTVVESAWDATNRR